MKRILLLSIGYFLSLQVLADFTITIDSIEAPEQFINSGGILNVAGASGFGAIFTNTGYDRHARGTFASKNTMVTVWDSGPMISVALRPDRYQDRKILFLGIFSVEMDCHYTVVLSDFDAENGSIKVALRKNDPAENPSSYLD